MATPSDGPACVDEPAPAGELGVGRLITSERDIVMSRDIVRPVGSLFAGGRVWLARREPDALVRRGMRPGPETTTTRTSNRFPASVMAS